MRVTAVLLVLNIVFVAFNLWALSTGHDRALTPFALTLNVVASILCAVSLAVNE